MIPLPGLGFHHFGMAARDAGAALRTLAALGYQCGPQVHDPLQGVHLHWCTRPGQPAVEVVSALEGQDSPLGAVLASQGTSFYHLCFEAPEDTAASLARLRDEGLRIVTVRPPLPAVLFGGRQVSFHVVQGFGLVELLEPPTA